MLILKQLFELLRLFKFDSFFEETKSACYINKIEIHQLSFFRFDLMSNLQRLPSLAITAEYFDHVHTVACQGCVMAPANDR